MLNLSTQFKIFHAIEVKLDGSKHPAYAIKRKNKIGLWVPVRSNYLNIVFSKDEGTLTFETQKDAQDKIKDLVARLSNSLTIKINKKIVTQETFEGVSIRVKRVLKEQHDKSIISDFYLEKKVLWLWVSMTDADISHMGNSSRIRTLTMREMRKNITKLKNKILEESKTTTNTIVKVV